MADCHRVRTANGRVMRAHSYRRRRNAPDLRLAHPPPLLTYSDESAGGPPRPVMGSQAGEILDALIGTVFVVSSTTPVTDGASRRSPKPRCVVEPPEK